MTSINLTIMEDAYILLKRQKLQGESFSEVIRRVCANQPKTFLDYAGVLKITDEEAKEMHAIVASLRRLSTRKLPKLPKNLKNYPIFPS